MKAINDAMTYEDVRLNKPSNLSLKKELKRVRESDINKMTTGQILVHLIVRHKFPLVVVYALAATALLIVKW
jgi:hypothetical protein